MKKLIKLTIITLCLFCYSAHPISAIVKADTNNFDQNYGYYKALSSCLLFKTSDVSNMDITNVLFIIPEGYFVKKISEISTTTLKVSYNSISGYVMTERVKLVSFLPKAKYLEGITFDIVQSSGTQIWKLPSSNDSSNILYSHIKSGTINIKYIAEARGEIPTGATSPVWYYCHYSPESDPTSVYAGYIHKEKTTNLTTIPLNTEDDVIIKNESEINETDTLNLDATVKTILICLISLPLLSIIIVLLLSSRRKAKIKKIIEQENMTETSTNENNYDYEDKLVKEHRNSKKISDFKNKKYSIKDKFNNFVFEEEVDNKNQFSFSNISFDDDEDLL